MSSKVLKGPGGTTNTDIYSVWANAKGRCNNPGHPMWPWYGGRGVRMCKEWKDDFMAFLQDMGERPDGLVLDRKDNVGNYEPGNCHWVTWHESAKNRRQKIVG